MRVAIHSIQSTLFEGEAQEVIAETPLGQMAVLDHHLPLISQINGPLFAVIQKNGERLAIPMTGGFLEVRPGSEIVVLVQ